VRYLGRKAAFYLVAVWAALSLNFLLPRMMPGNPVDVIIARTQNTTPLPPEARHALELQFGIGGKSLWHQYLDYLGGLSHLDFGVSITYYPAPVSTVVAQALPWTVALIGVATTISFVLGMGLGTLAGFRRGSWLDAVVPSATFLAAVPYFWLALVLLYLLGNVWQVFPLAGGYDDTVASPGWSGAFIGTAVYHGFLPALTIVMSSVAGWMLGMRNMMVSTMSEDYVLTAEAKGLRPRRVMLAYAARNAVLPSVSGFAISLGFVVAGSVVTEAVFSYPGIGFALLQAVQNADYPLMQALFLVITLTVLGANFLVDLLYTLIDPRTRHGG
jgi:peptide/nickel transport system permease protein